MSKWNLNTKSVLEVIGHPNHYLTIWRLMPRGVFFVVWRRIRLPGKLVYGSVAIWVVTHLRGTYNLTQNVITDLYLIDLSSTTNTFSKPSKSTIRCVEIQISWSFFLHSHRSSSGIFGRPMNHCIEKQVQVYDGGHLIYLWQIARWIRCRNYMFGLSKIEKKPQKNPPWNEHFRTWKWMVGILICFLWRVWAYFQGQNWQLVLRSGDPLTFFKRAQDDENEMGHTSWLYIPRVSKFQETPRKQCIPWMVLGAMTRGWRKSQWGWWLWLRLCIITVSFIITKCSCCGCCYDDDDDDDNDDDDNNHDSSVKSGWSCVFQSSYVEDTAPPSIWGQLQCNPVRNACDKTCPNHFPGTSKRRYEKKHIITHNIYTVNSTALELNMQYTSPGKYVIRKVSSPPTFEAPYPWVASIDGRTFYVEAAIMRQNLLLSGKVEGGERSFCCWDVLRSYSTIFTVARLGADFYEMSCEILAV